VLRKSRPLRGHREGDDRVIGNVRVGLVVDGPVRPIEDGEAPFSGDPHATLRRVTVAPRDPSHCGVIYGGSIDAGNAEAVHGTPVVDELLVGRAALDPPVFVEIARSVLRAPESVR
jgi:hypothetical protein